MDYQNHQDKMNIFAIIVTFNPEKEDLKQQHQALYPQVAGFVYVDNNSDDSSFLSEISDDKTYVIRNQKNDGLASAQNKAIKKAKAEGADAVLLFDQDSIPSENMVEILEYSYVEASKSGKVATIGPAIFKANTSEKEKISKGVKIHGFTIKRFKIGELSEVSYRIASGSLIPLRVIEDVGLIEEKLFIDGLDMEWCLRARSKGYKIFETNRAILNHCLGNGSVNRIKSHSPQREYYINRNSVWMIRQNHIPIGLKFRRLLFSAGRILQSLIQCDFKYAQKGIIGMIDGIKL